MAYKFVTQKGSSSLTTDPFYVGLVQHERTMSKAETYEYLAEKLGFTKTAIRAAFLAFKKYIRDNADRGNATNMSDVATFRTTCKGAFATLSGPWVKGINWLQLNAVPLMSFKNTLAGIIPTNKTEGAKPTIDTVLDETTGIYDVITGTDPFTVAGSDLGPDMNAEDEYVCIADATGAETKAAITSSSLQSVSASFATAPTAGTYTLIVYTRSGLGSEFGIKKATRKITIA